MARTARPGLSTAQTLEGEKPARASERAWPGMRQKPWAPDGISERKVLAMTDTKLGSRNFLQLAESRLPEEEGKEEGAEHPSC